MKDIVITFAYRQGKWRILRSNWRELDEWRQQHSRGAALCGTGVQRELGVFARDRYFTVRVSLREKRGYALLLYQNREQYYYYYRRSWVGFAASMLVVLRYLRTRLGTNTLWIRVAAKGKDSRTRTYPPAHPV